MEKPIIKLDKAEIEKHIRLGDNCEGGYVLAAAPDGSQARIHWMAKNRAWDPWPQDWNVTGIPALFADGSGEESELAQERLTDFRLIKLAREMQEAEDIGLAEIAERLIPDEWQDAQDESVRWLADAFLAACNGDGTDLNKPAPWGFRHAVRYAEGDEEIAEPPAEFEWAE